MKTIPDVKAVISPDFDIIIGDFDKGDYLRCYNVDGESLYTKDNIVYYGYRSNKYSNILLIPYEKYKNFKEVVMGLKETFGITLKLEGTDES